MISFFVLWIIVFCSSLNKFSILLFECNKYKKQWRKYNENLEMSPLQYKRTHNKCFLEPTPRIKSQNEEQFWGKLTSNLQYFFL